jgi:hypothetical protein
MGALSCKDGQRFCGEKDSGAAEQLMDQVRSGSLTMKQYKLKIPFCVTDRCKHCACDRADHKAGNGAMSTLIMYKFPLPIQDIKTKAELNFPGKRLCDLDAIVVAALLPLNVSSGTISVLLSLISLSVDKGALTSLNLSSNNLEAEGGKIVAEAIKVTNNAMGVVLVQFACPSGHWLNCCCLLLSTG